jgi:hypothetical protein
MTTTLEQDTFQDPTHASKDTKRAAERPNAETWNLRANPYTVKNLDSVIAHIEMAVAMDDNIAVFGRRYWRARVERIASTPQIMPAQARRLRDLLDQLAEA